ncbi:MAG: hypothetical protein WC314_05235 [Vulcanimicrobiota bacterium]
MRFFLILVSLLALTFPALANPDVLPFPVKLGDQSAAMTESSIIYAVVAKPVAAGTAMSVKEVEGQIIVNVFPADDKGTVQNGVQPFIMLFDASTSKSLSDNMQGKQLPGGWYLANVVGGGKTSRILFQVK